MLYLGAFGEEFGWRGFALDRLQARWNALVSSMILGVIWGVWHAPLILSTGRDFINAFILPIPASIFYSILFTWVYNNTEGNIFGVILLHALGNVAKLMITTVDPTFTGIYWIYYNFGIYIIVNILVVAVFGYKTLVREPNQ